MNSEKVEPSWKFLHPFSQLSSNFTSLIREKCLNHKTFQKSILITLFHNQIILVCIHYYCLWFMNFSTQFWKLYSCFFFLFKELLASSWKKAKHPNWVEWWKRSRSSNKSTTKSYFTLLFFFFFAVISL